MERALLCCELPPAHQWGAAMASPTAGHAVGEAPRDFYISESRLCFPPPDPFVCPYRLIPELECPKRLTGPFVDCPILLDVLVIPL